MFKFQYQNGKKQKKSKNLLGYKSGQEGLQIGAALGISNHGKKITNRGKEISNWGRDYKSRQEGLQIGAEQFAEIYIFT